MCCSVLQCVAVCCSVLRLELSRQAVAVCPASGFVSVSVSVRVATSVSVSLPVCVRMYVCCHMSVIRIFNAWAMRQYARLF